MRLSIKHFPDVEWSTGFITSNQWDKQLTGRWGKANIHNR